MKRIILPFVFLPSFAYAGYCENLASFYAMASFWKVDGVSKELAMERVDQLEPIYTDYDTGKKNTSELKEMVESIYSKKYIKANDKDISAYAPTIVAGYATIEASCLADHPE